MRRLLAVLLLLFSTSFAVADEQWVEIQSPNFQLITNGGEKRGREVLESFEQMRAGFGVLFNKLNVNSSVPLTIVGFRSRKEMARYGPMFNGKPVDDAGFFQMGEDRNFVVIDLSVPSEQWAGTVFHEYAHVLINSNLASLPAWLDEGYAEYCSSLVVEGKFVKLGLPVASDVQQLRDNRWLPIPDLLAIKHDSRDYNEGNRRSVFYAESWLLVHYLLSTKQIQKAGAYLTLQQQQGVAIPEAFQKTFGMDGNAFLKELQKYFRDNLHYFQAPAPAGIDHMAMRPRPLSPLEAQVTLADLHYQARDHQQEGIAEFQQIVKQEADNEIANRELGYAYLRIRDYGRASEFFARAAKKGSNDPRVHYYTALLLAREASGPEQAPAGQFILLSTDSDRIEQILAESKRALELDPSHSDAWGLLGYAQSVQGSLDDAIASTKRALELAPRNDSYRINLASMLMQDKKYDQAGELLAGLKSTDNPVMAAQVQQMLEFLQKVRDEDRQPAANQVENARLATASGEENKADLDASLPPSHGRVAFAKGKVVKVECTGESANLILETGHQRLAMHVRSTQTVAVIGADKFSCDWHNQPVAINYSILGENEFSVISIELP